MSIAWTFGLLCPALTTGDGCAEKAEVQRVVGVVLEDQAVGQGVADVFRMAWGGARERSDGSRGTPYVAAGDSHRADFVKRLQV